MGAGIYNTIFHMNIVKIILSVLAVFSGAFLFVYGEFDDSPGGQLLGILIAVVGVVGTVKSYHRIK